MTALPLELASYSVSTICCTSMGSWGKLVRSALLQLTSVVPHPVHPAGQDCACKPPVSTSRQLTTTCRFTAQPVGAQYQSYQEIAVWHGNKKNQYLQYNVLYLITYIRTCKSDIASYQFTLISPPALSISSYTTALLGPISFGNVWCSDRNGRVLYSTLPSAARAHTQVCCMQEVVFPVNAVWQLNFEVAGYRSGRKLSYSVRSSTVR